MAKLTEAQWELLDWLGSADTGVIDITDERVVNRLINKGLAVKVYCGSYANSYPVWRITPAGRAALEGTG